MERVDIIAGEVRPDHIHMLVSIPLKMSASGFIGYLKRKSAMMKSQKIREYEVHILKPRILV